MSKSRTKLRKILIEILSSADASYEEGHLYFRRPSGRLNYPCILYDLTGEEVRYADDRKYVKCDRYLLTVIDEDEDSPLKEAINELPYCTFDRSFQSEGLNHFVFTIFV